jgi:phosphoglycolate phosphatase-like HAD superfamily hydrolase
MAVPLILFDVDGTLCDTSEVDDRVFCEVATKLIGSTVTQSSWQGAPQITDAGIVDWLWRKHFNRSPTLTEVQAFRAAFERALAAELERSGAQFREIPGAAKLLVHLEELGWSFAFATGGWAPTARLKLLAAQLPTSPLLASSNDSADRVTIFSLARSRASVREEPTVLVGDGVWDVTVARALGWSFVGVGRSRQGLLQTAGAQALVADFSDLQTVLAALRTAPPPRHPGGGVVPVAG